MFPDCNPMNGRKVLLRRRSVFHRSVRLTYSQCVFGERRLHIRSENNEDLWTCSVAVSSTEHGDANEASAWIACELLIRVFAVAVRLTSFIPDRAAASIIGYCWPGELFRLQTFISLYSTLIRHHNNRLIDVAPYIIVNNCTTWQVWAFKKYIMYRLLMLTISCNFII